MKGHKTNSYVVTLGNEMSRLLRNFNLGGLDDQHGPPNDEHDPQVPQENSFLSMHGFIN